MWNIFQTTSRRAHQLAFIRSFTLHAPKTLNPSGGYSPDIQGKIRGSHPICGQWASSIPHGRITIKFAWGPRNFLHIKVGTIILFYCYSIILYIISFIAMSKRSIYCWIHMKENNGRRRRLFSALMKVINSLYIIYNTGFPIKDARLL